VTLAHFGSQAAGLAAVAAAREGRRPAAVVPVPV